MLEQCLRGAVARSYREHMQTLLGLQDNSMVTTRLPPPALPTEAWERDLISCVHSGSLPPVSAARLSVCARTSEYRMSALLSMRTETGFFGLYASLPWRKRFLATSARGNDGCSNPRHVLGERRQSLCCQLCRAGLRWKRCCLKLPKDMGFDVMLRP